MSGWQKIDQFEPVENKNINTFVSVIVPCRNEESNLQELFSVLAQQSHQYFELIVVNDHSTDATQSLIRELKSSFPKVKLINAIGYGKKNAIKEGIYASKADLIITLDADAVPTVRWLDAIVKFQVKFPCDLIICPVKMEKTHNFWLRLQAIEFISLIASGAGAAGNNMPVLCNGANLAFTRRTWNISQTDLHEEELSGDDIFLLESVKKHHGVIRFLKSEAALVTTRPATTLHDFLHQRRRWASKSSSYTDKQLIAVTLIVFLTVLAELILFGQSFFDGKYGTVLGIFFILKFSIDISFLYQVRKFFHLKNIFIESMVLSLIYPFYAVFVGISGFLFKPSNWK
jgi:cellulose synthase/poly-beta-1,6-N-acetylglucosamine synthase-like glycosyltransferase